MKLFPDSADAGQWALASACPSEQGAIPNPTLILQAGMSVQLNT